MILCWRNSFCFVAPPLSGSAEPPLSRWGRKETQRKIRIRVRSINTVHPSPPSGEGPGMRRGREAAPSSSVLAADARASLPFRFHIFTPAKNHVIHQESGIRNQEEALSGVIDCLEPVCELKDRLQGVEGVPLTPDMCLMHGAQYFHIEQLLDSRLVQCLLD